MIWAEVPTKSHSRPGEFHSLIVYRGKNEGGGPVMECSCEGFVMRKTCRHAEEWWNKQTPFQKNLILNPWKPKN